MCDLEKKRIQFHLSILMIIQFLYFIHVNRAKVAKFDFNRGSTLLEGILVLR